MISIKRRLKPLWKKSLSCFLKYNNFLRKPPQKNQFHKITLARMFNRPLPLIILNQKKVGTMEWNILNVTRINNNLNGVDILILLCHRHIPTPQVKWWIFLQFALNQHCVGSAFLYIITIYAVKSSCDITLEGNYWYNSRFVLEYSLFNNLLY